MILCLAVNEHELALCFDDVHAVFLTNWCKIIELCTFIVLGWNNGN